MPLIANGAWHSLVERLLKQGEEVSPRGIKTLELLGHKTVVDMNYPMVVSKERKLGYKFMAAEAAWILSGDNRVSTIKSYSKDIVNFSDDGLLYFGAYGPQFRDQIRHVITSLNNDESTRQAVITLWRKNPPATKDVPCTISLQWMVRDGHLNCFVDMRSSDVWLGVPYDWFNFTMMTGYIALLLRELNGTNYRLGALHFYAHSQHLYETNALIASKLTLIDRVFDPPEFLLHGFDKPDDLITYLWSMADGVCLDYKHGRMGYASK
jgi:thymidylate synthase